MPHLVSLISDQPIPNLLFIQSVEQEVEGYIFISTSQMEKKQRTHWLKKAADLPEERCQTVLVEAEKYYDILQALEEKLPIDTQYLVNLTGGNKLMMLACYQFFISNRANNLFYLPIGEQIFQNMRSPAGLCIPVTYELTVWEYLTAYGVGFEAAERTLHDYTKAQDILQMHRKHNFNRHKVLKQLQQKNDYLQDKFYYDGGWFEEFLYYSLVKIIKISSDQIFLNVTFKSGDGENRNVNELDVVFVYHNELFIIEAKASVLDQNHVKKSYGYSVADNRKLGQILYKMASINRGLGIRTNSILITLSDLSKETENFYKTLHDKLTTLQLQIPEDQRIFQTDEILNSTINNWINRIK